MAKQPEKKDEVETTGHSWDGIEEYNNPLPKWWVWVFYICIIWAIGYSIAYPAWPGIKSATAGVLGWSTRANVAEEIETFAAKNQAINAELASVELASINENETLKAYAISAGEATFNTWCAQCHQRNGAGVKGAGYPTLSDDAWLWGGTMEEIHYTVAHGIRNEDDDDARYSEMPAFGRDELLEPEEIASVVNFVMTLSGETPNDASGVEDGKVLFEDNCASCHGEDGKGDRAQGAPNLTDAIWLYGGDYDTIMETVTNSRFGVMPPWSAEASPAGRLEEWQIRAVATYVHQLGGGE
ncbi:cytochrome-c oxidase, cbb3-type subunit III [Rhodalgimonas zhirmunskyi]|uniref:Cbb3-type cytochrome c oxidase subunit n=1 Tax=Rhodalgimonas zhirmunskyi TaxID=2964767 RepID=A0AAJ1X750_9RHOB|nr:cytochrome-c oxidase, cbb3-type subunit III [Rhodoalgimonas zhirmunskyi]MDQ2094162.1 cytochrome-c oxidase, cbb3-type subunit III [Rhodoalgimonas zhirmunskyi]